MFIINRGCLQIPTVPLLWYAPVSLDRNIAYLWPQMADNCSQICLCANCQRYFASISIARCGVVHYVLRGQSFGSLKKINCNYIYLGFRLELAQNFLLKNYILAVDETEQVIVGRRRGEPLICRIRRESKLNVAVSKKYYVCVTRELFDRRLQIKPKSSMFVVTKICVPLQYAR